MTQIKIPEYDEKMDEVAKKYAIDIVDQIEEHYPKGFFTDHNIQYDVEGILSEMYREIKPNEKEEK